MFELQLLLLVLRYNVLLINRVLYVFYKILFYLFFVFLLLFIDIVEKVRSRYVNYYYYNTGFHVKSQTNRNEFLL